MQGCRMFAARFAFLGVTGQFGGDGGVDEVS
jgi:hypothetical protein